MKGSSIQAGAPHDTENPNPYQYLLLEARMMEELKLDIPSPTYPLRCIFRVPHRLRCQPGKAVHYTPQVISIGPLHHGNPALKAMEEHKKRYLQYFMARHNKLSLTHYITKIKHQEARLRSCYSETIVLESDEFVKIILVDAIFIIEFLFRHWCSILLDENDCIFGKPGMVEDVWPDLLMLENQLPFFILVDLFDPAIFPIPSENSERLSITFLSHHFLNGIRTFGKLSDDLETICFSEVEHFVDLLRKLYIAPMLKKQSKPTIESLVDVGQENGQCELLSLGTKVIGAAASLGPIVKGAVASLGTKVIGAAASLGTIVKGAVASLEAAPLGRTRKSSVVSMEAAPLGRTRKGPVVEMEAAPLGRTRKGPVVEICPVVEMEAAPLGRTRKDPVVEICPVVEMEAAPLGRTRKGSAASLGTNVKGTTDVIGDCVSLGTNKIGAVASIGTDESSESSDSNWNVGSTESLGSLRSTLFYQKKKAQSAGQSKNTTPRIEELHLAGVEFKERSTKNFFDIQFKYGILKIPKLKTEDKTELILRNLVAFEQCSTFEISYISDYVGIMDQFVHTPKDVELLVKNEIVENILRGGDDALSTMFNSVSTGIIPTNNVYGTLCEELNKFCSSKWNKSMANLRQKYFNTPWATISVCAAAILLILTLVQTINLLNNPSFLSVNNNGRMYVLLSIFSLLVSLCVLASNIHICVVH